MKQRTKEWTKEDNKIYFSPYLIKPLYKYLQSLDWAQGGEQSFADSLQLVVVKWKQVEVLQVVEGVDSQTVNFVGVQ